jgi:AraC-like DNA-binding protein
MADGVLQRATELIRHGRSGLAEIAACTAFADQSHLARWVRRVHGVSLGQLASYPEPNQNSKNVHDPSHLLHLDLRCLGQQQRKYGYASFGLCAVMEEKGPFVVPNTR